jgi:hypothetical protein
MESLKRIDELFNVQFVRPYGGDIWKIKGMQKAE